MAKKGQGEKRVKKNRSTCKREKGKRVNPPSNVPKGCPLSLKPPIRKASRKTQIMGNNPPSKVRIPAFRK